MKKKLGYTWDTHILELGIQLDTGIAIFGIHSISATVAILEGPRSRKALAPFH